MLNYKEKGYRGSIYILEVNGKEHKFETQKAAWEWLREEEEEMALLKDIIESKAKECTPVSIEILDKYSGE